ncbi:MAG: hypothetical protein V9E82_10285 [Candidatus Nanopelagicales bacterium]
MTVQMPAQPAPEKQPVQVVPETPLESLFTSGAFPSANLLPPAIRNRRLVHAAKRKALLMLAGVIGLLVLLVAYTGVQQRAANAAKADAQARVDAAMVLKQRYAYVPAAYQAVTTARTDLATAMGQEVQVSRLLGGLSRMQPLELSLVTLDAVVGPGEKQAMTTSQTVIPGVGTVAFTGEAKTMDDIAAWMDSLRLNADYASPVLTDVTNSTEGLYSFSATAQLTDQALSGRYLEATQ